MSRIQPTRPTTQSLTPAARSAKQAIADEVVLRGRFDLAGNPDDGAHAVLTGKITNFIVTPVRFDAQGLAEEYEVSIMANMEFVRTDASEEVLWRNPNYIFRTNYELDEQIDPTSFFDREVLAIEAVSVFFAQTLLTDLMTGF